jgi:hypothetical protein
MKWSSSVTRFLFHLKLPFSLPPGVGVLDVFDDPQIRAACKAFYDKFYADSAKRHLLIGINPGRFGGGVTGVPFTDPIRLEKACGIPNTFPKKQELSSVFMYEMMEALGGVTAFYKQFYISAISPLGFVQNGKNLNYYDNAQLKQRIEPFVVDCLEKQLSWGIYRDSCFCIGEGTNLKYLTALNEKYRWFTKIEGLPHPRFIMQYKLKQKQAYIERYRQALEAVQPGK